MRSVETDTSYVLPKQLSARTVKRAVWRLESELIDFARLAGMRGFSAVVGQFGAKILKKIADYDWRHHPSFGGPRFPLRGLVRRRGRAANPRDRLVSKGSKRTWAIQSHYDHPGWYIIWRYLVDPTESQEKGKSVIIWRVDVVFLEKSNRKYEGSKAGEAGGGRTHTFGIKGPSRKLKGAAVYRRKDVILRAGKPVSRNGNGD